MHSRFDVNEKLQSKSFNGQLFKGQYNILTLIVDSYLITFPEELAAIRAEGGCNFPRNSNLFYQLFYTPPGVLRKEMKGKERTKNERKKSEQRNGAYHNNITDESILSIIFRRYERIILYQTYRKSRLTARTDFLIVLLTSERNFPIKL